MDRETRLEWDKFLNGHWQKEVPNKVGEYFLATINGELCVTHDLIYKDHETQKCKSSKGWGGFWWSEPIPHLPEVPEHLIRKR